MNFGDLLDQIAENADDNTSTFRTSARRWLNFARSYIADRSPLWRTALDTTATFQTSAATTSGIYTIGAFQSISGDRFYDETNQNTIQHESLADLNSTDPAKTTTGPPAWWGDAGAVTASGARRIYLWPIPNGTFTIRFGGYAEIADVTSAMDTDTVDAFFGMILPWGATFTAGMRYYHDLDNNEDVQQMALQLQAFNQLIKVRKSTNRLAPVSGIQSNVIRTRRVITAGRFDPAHFRN